MDSAWVHLIRCFIVFKADWSNIDKEQSVHKIPILYHVHLLFVRFWLLRGKKNVPSLHAGTTTYLRHKNQNIYWCLYRHLCDLPERFGKTDLWIANLISVSSYLAIHVIMPKRHNVVSSQAPVVSMTTRLIWELVYF